ncbi:uncharacterized protein K460DRAFT_270563 [Cucurbitaria berberidis CBS 394.84]|uniref:Wax synthase domain-containing protein n=1 Tax=Cucurbitaria berberidis CBS 394.84 TaxID=1168544 RepID=A0A9P4LER8_9PLEO|nr:uncharacterized protein K460DRAFT_270563 [Cucurbitaria berberidis CBS 394.84]KAF1851344.1 hypothetical protein K460DRAFT_270563 [Cucurbitaria berberidis CBS 394.84]
MDETQSWTFESALVPIISTLLAFAYGLYLLAYPPQYKKLSILLLGLPVTYAFIHQLDLAPNWTVCDTFGRFLYIWYAHMSYEVLILEFTPPVGKEKEGWTARMREAYKVLFDRNHTQLAKTISTKHGYGSRWQFVAYHCVKASALYLAMAAWDAYESFLSTTRSVASTREQAYFFRRLASSSSPLNTREMYFRLETVFDWCIISMVLYEAYHSLCAVLFVGILRLDMPSEWSLSLCGGVAEAWSVRRYWGKHWHNYIYHSFSAHVKIVTRGWLGLGRGRLETRLVENGLVFLVSGLMHSLVRWQQDPDGDVWCITIWYVAQMLPIVVEDVVQIVWHYFRQRVGISGDDRRVDTLETLVGYVWVLGWFMWSVPKYIHTSDAWAEDNFRGRYAASWEEVYG